MTPFISTLQRTNPFLYNKYKKKDCKKQKILLIYKYRGASIQPDICSRRAKYIMKKNIPLGIVLCISFMLHAMDDSTSNTNTRNNLSHFYGFFRTTASSLPKGLRRTEYLPKRKVRPHQARVAIISERPNPTCPNNKPPLEKNKNTILYSLQNGSFNKPYQ